MKFLLVSLGVIIISWESTWLDDFFLIVSIVHQEFMFFIAFTDLHKMSDCEFDVSNNTRTTCF